MNYTPTSADYGHPVCPRCGNPAAIGDNWMRHNTTAISRPAWCTDPGCGWYGSEQGLTWLYGALSTYMPRERAEELSR